jgi:DNA-binding response OmpR family regulator
MLEAHCSVLLVEDDPHDATFVRETFDQAAIHHLLVTVTDGADAIRYLKGDGPYADRQRFPMPSIVLLDLKLPNVNGFQVIKWVRSHPNTKRLPIIVLSGTSVPGDCAHAYELGANSFITKPFGFHNFSTAINAMTEFWLECCKLPNPG